MAGRRKRIDGHDPQQINAALSFAMRSKKPTLIACRTIIGLGAPTKAGTAATHGSPLGRPGGGRREGGARLARAAVHRARRPAGAVARRRQPRRRRPSRLAQAPRPQQHARRVRARDGRQAAGQLARGGRRAEAGDRRHQTQDRHPPVQPEGAGGAGAGDAGADRRFGRPHRVQPHLREGHGHGQRRQLRRPLHPLRRPRARHGRGGERHGAAWRADPLHRHVLHLHRLHAPGDPHRRDHARRT